MKPVPLIPTLSACLLLLPLGAPVSARPQKEPPQRADNDPEPESIKPLHTFASPGAVYCLAFSPDGKRLAGGGRGAKSGAVVVWDLTTDKPAATFTGHADFVRCVAYHPDGKRVASGDRGGQSEGELKVWDAVTGKELLAVNKSAGDAVHWAAFSPDGKWLAANDWKKNEPTVKVWDASSGKLLLTLEGGDGSSACGVFSPDGKRLAVSHVFDVKVFDAATGEKLLTLKGNRMVPVIAGLAYSPDGKYIAVAPAARRGQTLGRQDREGGPHLPGTRCRRGGVRPRYWAAGGDRRSAPPGRRRVQLPV
jgi:WD40 repeat protein